MLRRLLLAIGALFCLGSALMGVKFSGATWTDTSQTPVEVSAASDWTPPAVSLSGVPSGIATGTTVTVKATVTDTRSAIATGSVTIEYAPSASITWTPLTVCTTSSVPNGLTYSCSWDTTNLTVGDYQLRAAATDTAGNSATSSVVTTTVTSANSLDVVLDTIPSAIRLTTTLNAHLFTVANADTKMDLSYRPVGGSTWTEICHQDQKTQQKEVILNCAWNTLVPRVADGSYEIRAHATVQGTDSNDYQTVLVDNTAPSSATINVPAGVLSGAVDLTGTAADATSGVTSLIFQYGPAGASSWTDCGTDTSPPYACRINTTGLPNGASYDFRVIAADGAGNTTASSPETRTVDNTPTTVTVTSPAEGATVDGAVAVKATAQAPGGVQSVSIGYRPRGATTPLTPLCTAPSAPYSCSWDTTSLAAGGYELQAVMTRTTGGAVTSPTRTVNVDHSVGSVAITTPADAATVHDPTSVTVSGSTSSTQGVASVALKATGTGAGAVTTSTPCTLGNGTFTCTWSTTGVVYAAYDLRAEMTQGNSVVVTSAPVRVTVDNVKASVTLILSPSSAGGYVAGAETLTATPDSNLAVSSVGYDVSPAGQNAWTQICAPAAATPYACAWDTTTRTNGDYDLRAVMTLANGATVMSSPTTVHVVNLAAVSIATTNGGIANVPDANDKLIFTYSAKVDPASIRTGWTGASTPVTLSFNDGTLDSIAVDTSNLGLVTFTQDYVQKNQNLKVPGTMSVDATGKVITVILGTVPSNKVNPAIGGSSSMTWTPMSDAKDFYLQRASATTPVTQSGQAW